MVGIPTCYGGKSLVQTAQSIMASVGIPQFRFIIVADRTPITKQNQEKLRTMGIELYWNKKEGSQFKKIKQIVSMCDSDILVVTQDDVVFERDTLATITRSFQENPIVTMLGVRVLPLRPRTFFESITNVEMRLHDSIARNWNHALNYFSASGRCVAFRSALMKQFRIPESVVNGDTYLYLENKRLHGTFSYQPRAIVYIRSPQTLKDQVGPSNRFRYSQAELSKYFDFDISKEYRIPLVVLAKAFLEEFIQNPLFTMLFACVFLITRTRKQPVAIVSNPVWKVDVSTKSLS